MVESSLNILVNISEIQNELIIMGLLLFLSMFFSASETIFASVNVLRLKTYVEEKKPGSAKALWVSDKFDRTLSTILFGNNIANIGLAVVSATVFYEIFKDMDLVKYVDILNTAIMTTIVLIFGEILPKSYAKQNSDKLSLVFGPILYVLIKLLSPFVLPFLLIRKLFLRENKEHEVSVTEDELETILDTMEDEGVIDEDEADMIEAVLNLKEKTVYDIMTPRVDVIGIEKSMTSEEVKELFFTYKYSRLPVYDKDKDNIIGVVSERDFLTHIVKGIEYKLEDLMYETIFVSKAMKLDSLIEELQIKNQHIAIVIGEHGGTSGLVTMEDALEELVGEIYDEHDEHQSNTLLIETGENKYNVDASLPIEKLFDELDINHEVDAQYSNISGWLYELSEALPTEGANISYNFVESKIEEEHLVDYNYTFLFTIKKIIDKRIKNCNLKISKETKNKEENKKDQKSE